MANPWFRLYSEFEDDPKVQMMSEADQRRLVMLFCQRCKEQRRTDSQQSFKWRVSLDEVARTKAIFIENGFIDENWNVVNWEKRQPLWDSSAERTRQYRERIKQSETSQERHSDVDTVTSEQSVTPRGEERRIEQIRTEERRRASAQTSINAPGDFSSLLSISQKIIPPKALPKNKGQMIAEGYTYDNSRPCSVCGEALEWWKSRAGKCLPILAASGELHLGNCAAEMRKAE